MPLQRAPRSPRAMRASRCPCSLRRRRACSGRAWHESQGVARTQLRQAAAGRRRWRGRCADSRRGSARRRAARSGGRRVAVAGCRVRPARRSVRAASTGCRHRPPGAGPGDCWRRRRAIAREQRVGRRRASCPGSTRIDRRRGEVEVRRRIDPPAGDRDCIDVERRRRRSPARRRRPARGRRARRSRRAGRCWRCRARVGTTNPPATAR